MADVTVNLKGFDKAIKALNKSFGTKGMSIIGIKALELNSNQIRDQVDRNGARFPKYSKRYQAVRSARGRDNKVDLVGFVTKGGQATMLQSFGIQKESRAEVVIGFPNPQEKRKALGVLENKKRPIPFVGLNKNSRIKLFKFIFKRFKI